MYKINDNFRNALSTLNIKQNDIAKKYEISRQSVNKLATDQKSITEILIKICDEENININYIATGKGNILNTNENINYKNENIKMINKLDDEKLKIYYYRLKADTLESL